MELSQWHRSMDKILNCLFCKESIALHCMVVQGCTVCFDYCNCLVDGLPAYSLDRLHSNLNASARLVCGLSKFERVASVLRDRLRRLPVQQRTVPFDLQKAAQAGATIHHRAVQACLNSRLSSRAAFRGVGHSPNPNRVREEGVRVCWTVCVNQPTRQLKTTYHNFVFPCQP